MKDFYCDSIFHLEIGTPKHIIITETTLDEIAVKIESIVENVRNKCPKNMTIVNLDIPTSDWSSFIAWFNNARENWKHPLSVGSESPTHGEIVKFKIRICNDTNRFNGIDDFVFDFEDRTEVPSAEEMKKLYRQFVALEGKKDHIKIRIKNGVHFTPRDFIDAFREANPCSVSSLFLPVYSSDDGLSFCYMMKNLARLDLHRCKNAEQAEFWTYQHLQLACRTRREKVFVLTGRGKHVNSNGQRGVISQKFRGWLKKMDFVQGAFPSEDHGSWTVRLQVPVELTVDIQEPEIDILAKIVLMLVGYQMVQLNITAPSKVQAATLLDDLMIPVQGCMARLGLPVDTFECGSYADNSLISVFKMPLPGF